jgi:hypothetical protein
VSYGFFSVQGTQAGTAAGNRQTLGPFNVPFGPIVDTVYYTLTAGTQTIPCSPSCLGVCIIPPIGNPPGGVTLKLKTVPGDSGIFISTEEPTIVQWDAVNSEVPGDIYLVASGNIDVTVQFL